MPAYAVFRRARRDLDEIWWYGAETYSLDQANTYDGLLHDAFERLVAFPLSGPAVPERRDGVRMLLQGSHVIVYSPDPLVIVRVLHQASDWQRLMNTEHDHDDT